MPYHALKGRENNNNRTTSRQQNPIISIPTRSSHETHRIHFHGHGNLPLARQRARSIRPRRKFAHNASTHSSQFTFSDTVSLETRLRPTLPSVARRRHALLVPMRSRSAVHLQWLRRLHALQYQQRVRQLRINAARNAGLAV
jgi:hypothetical protein